MVSPLAQIESLYKRLEKAREIVANGKVHPILNLEGHYAVESSTGGSYYLVNGQCTCPDAQERTEVHKGWCKHKLAVEIFKESQAQAQAPELEHPTDDEIDQMAAHYQAQPVRSLEEEIADLFPKG